MDKVEGTPTQFSALERRYIRRMQPDLRAGATQAGHYRTCRLPKCRRAKRCTGCHPADEIATTHFKRFPPCVYSDAMQASLLRGWRTLAEMEWQRWLAKGYTQEELERLADEHMRAMEEDEDWPADPLCPPPRTPAA